MSPFLPLPWTKARVAAKFGEGASGHSVKLGGSDEFLTPYAAGVPGVVRVVYLPRSLGVAVRKLEPDARYVAAPYDPVSGRREEIGPAKPDADGSWTASPPSGWDGDWVLLLEVQGAKP